MVTVVTVVTVVRDRRSGQAFTAGDLKLVTAIASQIGAAIQNARLVRQSLDQQRLQQESSFWDRCLDAGSPAPLARGLYASDRASQSVQIQFHTI